ncbi:MAG: hypothetical protein JSR97_03880, partial [Verrucomicrobia bacterium]|nr:hypothetical protein [Verrucomicrobiota bacterium]
IKGNKPKRRFEGNRAINKEKQDESLNLEKAPNKDDSSEKVSAVIDLTDEKGNVHIDEGDDSSHSSQSQDYGLGQFYGQDGIKEKTALERKASSEMKKDSNEPPFGISKWDAGESFQDATFFEPKVSCVKRKGGKYGFKAAGLNGIISFPYLGFENRSLDRTEFLARVFKGRLLVKRLGKDSEYPNFCISLNTIVALVLRRGDVAMLRGGDWVKLESGDLIALTEDSNK